jgi:hypothetical protein
MNTSTPQMAKTGDLAGNVDRAVREARRLRHSAALAEPDALALRLGRGDPLPCLQLLHHALLRYSPHVARMVCEERGLGLAGKTDRAFAEGALRFLREALSLKPGLSAAQLLEPGAFAERRCIALADACAAVRREHEARERMARLRGVKAVARPSERLVMAGAGAGAATTAVAATTTTTAPAPRPRPPLLQATTVAAMIGCASSKEVKVATAELGALARAVRELRGAQVGGDEEAAEGDDDEDDEDGAWWSGEPRQQQPQSDPYPRPTYEQVAPIVDANDGGGGPVAPVAAAPAPATATTTATTTAALAACHARIASLESELAESRASAEVAREEFAARLAVLEGKVRLLERAPSAAAALSATRVGGGGGAAPTTLPPPPREEHQQPPASVVHKGSAKDDTDDEEAAYRHFYRQFLSSRGGMATTSAAAAAATAPARTSTAAAPFPPPPPPLASTGGGPLADAVAASLAARCDEATAYLDALRGGGGGSFGGTTARVKTATTTQPRF